MKTLAIIVLLAIAVGSIVSIARDILKSNED